MKKAIYLLRDIKLDIVGYVGQSVDPHARLQQHVEDGKGYLQTSGGKWSAPVTTNRAGWIAYLLSKGREPAMEVIEVASDPNARERYWIAEMLRKGEPLTNDVSGQFLETYGVKGYNPYHDCPYDIDLNAEARRPTAVYTFDLAQLAQSPALTEQGETDD